MNLVQGPPVQGLLVMYVIARLRFQLGFCLIPFY